MERLLYLKEHHRRVELRTLRDSMVTAQWKWISSFQHQKSVWLWSPILISSTSRHRGRSAPTSCTQLGTPYYLSHHSHRSSTQLQPSLTIHTTSTITHTPHYLNHHTLTTSLHNTSTITHIFPSTLPQPSLTLLHYLIHHSLHPTTTITHT